LPKREEITGDRRKLHDEELYDLCFHQIFYPNDQTKENDLWQGLHEGKKNIAYRVLVTKPQEKRPLGRERHSWE
jgi:hypothetical protein